MLYFWLRDVMSIQHLVAALSCGLKLVSTIIHWIAVYDNIFIWLCFCFSRSSFLSNKLPEQWHWHWMLEARWYGEENSTFVTLYLQSAHIHYIHPHTHSTTRYAPYKYNDCWLMYCLCTPIVFILIISIENRTAKEEKSKWKSVVLQPV